MTVLAPHTPLPDPQRASAAAEPVRLVAIGKPLFALTQDADLIATLRKVSADVHDVLTLGAEIDLAGALMTHHAGVAVLDCAALTTAVAALSGRLQQQFPELVLVVAGTADEQSKLSQHITDGTVHRFLHRPFSDQRVRLFVEAAWRRQAELRAAPMAAAPARGAGRSRTLPWGRLGAGLVTAAAAIAAVVWMNRREPTVAPSTHAAVSQNAAPSSPQRDLHASESAPSAPAPAAPSSAAAVSADGHNAAPENTPVVPRPHAADARARPTDARVAEYLQQAQDALARGALLEPPQENARQYLDAAHAVSPDDPSVRAAQQELRAHLEEAARAALDAGKPEDADKLSAAALEQGSDPARIEALREDAQQLRTGAHTQALAQLRERFTERVAEGHLLDPDADSAKFYLAQLAQQDGAGAETAQARASFAARLLDEARLKVKAQDFAPAQRDISEARVAGADAGQLASVVAELDAAQAAGQQAASAVNEGILTRTRYVAAKFPDVARTRDISGWVDLEFTVAADGTVSEAHVLGAEPAGVFEQSALDAVRRWRYQPVTRAGQSVAQRARVRVRFAVAK